MRWRFGRVLMVVPALLILTGILTACSYDVGGRDNTTYREYRVTEVELYDGRTIECVFFGDHQGYDCNWDYNNDDE